MGTVIVSLQALQEAREGCLGLAGGYDAWRIGVALLLYSIAVAAISFVEESEADTALVVGVLATLGLLLALLGSFRPQHGRAPGGG